MGCTNEPLDSLIFQTSGRVMSTHVSSGKKPQRVSSKLNQIHTEKHTSTMTQVNFNKIQYLQNIKITYA